MSEDDLKEIPEVHGGKLTKAGHPLIRECSIKKKDMSVYPVELTISPLRDAQNTSCGFVTIIRDLTEKKELEKKLRNAERLAAIGELAGMVAHDLRNPLQGMKNAVYFLKKKSATLPEDRAKAMVEDN